LNSDSALERAVRSVAVVVKAAGSHCHQIACLTIVPRLNHANLINLRAVAVIRMRIGPDLMYSNIVVDERDLRSPYDGDVLG